MYNKINLAILDFLPKFSSVEIEQEFLLILISLIEKVSSINEGNFYKEEEYIRFRSQYEKELSIYKNYLLEDPSDINVIFERLGENIFLHSIFKNVQNLTSSFFENNPITSIIECCTEINLFALSFSEELKASKCVELYFAINLLNNITEDIQLQIRNLISIDFDLIIDIIKSKKNKIVSKKIFLSNELKVSKKTGNKIIEGLPIEESLSNVYFLSIEQIKKILVSLVSESNLDGFFKDVDINSKKNDLVVLDKALSRIISLRVETMRFMKKHNNLIFDIKEISFVMTKSAMLSFLKLIDSVTIYNDKKVKEAIEICSIGDVDKNRNNKKITFSLFEQSVFYALNKYSKKYNNIQKWEDIFLI